MILALNNYFLVEPYVQGQGIRPEMRAGLSLPGQKMNLVALKLLADSKVDGEVFPTGSLALIPEDVLMTAQWAKNVRKSPGVSGEFIVVESRHVVAVSNNE